MVRLGYSILLVAVTGTAALAQQSTPARSAFLPSSMVAVSKCDPIPTSSTTSPIVTRIRIPRTLDVADGERYVRRSDDSGTPNTDDEKLWKNAPAVNDDADETALTEFFDNPFHFAVSSLKLPPSDTSTYLKIIYILSDKRMRFWEIDPFDGGPKILGIGTELDRTTGRPKNEWVCQTRAANTVSSTNKGRSRVTVYVKRMRNLPDVASINLLLKASRNSNGAEGGGGTPIIIDPKIRNEGEP